ncbi:HAD family hydrolase [Salidesulfovibrio onnuriiensis]|uniref:HAD family hydrolase n=1 Tax=Salidesulfovibrio onnuriiensis TaxID=2583823 RepID=UPI00165077FD|nr:HAD family hydrolase [Salidesulfovibrio onnuriiensis]
MAVRGVVFDMDDTLCLERDYVKSGFRAVADHVRDAADAEEVFGALWAMFEEGVRGDTFNRLMDRFPTVAGAFDIPTLVSVYRNHTPSVSFLPGIGELLATLRGLNIKIGVLSDGPLASQQAKAVALGVYQVADAVMLTDSLGRECWKPSPEGFLRLEAELGLSGHELVYVGDNVEKDFIAPNRLGWATVRLRLREQLRCAAEASEEAAAPGHEVHSTEELSALLDTMKDG